jgi:hypothetical protein
MLRYEEEFLPPDPVFPEELAELGWVSPVVFPW